MVNSLSTKHGAVVQSVFAVIKVSALLVIIIIGVIYLALGKKAKVKKISSETPSPIKRRKKNAVKFFPGNTDNFSAPFEGSATEPGLIAVAIVEGYFAFKGWLVLLSITLYFCSVMLLLHSLATLAKLLKLLPCGTPFSHNTQ